MKNKPKLIICSNHAYCPEQNCRHRDPHILMKGVLCTTTNCRLGFKCKEIKS